MQSFKEPTEREIINAQRHFRSMARKNLHFSIFNADPLISWPELKMIPEYHQSELHYRLEKLIVQLVNDQKIINGSQLYHFTTLSNLASIAQCKYIYGNGYLKNEKIKFDTNVFTIMDNIYGDTNVICFCPGLVDIKAFVKDHCIKNNICRLSININQSSISNDKTVYNQFFKLSDMMFSWDHAFKIGDLKTKIKHDAGATMSIYLCLGQEQAEVKLKKNDYICYGNIFKINRFCAIQLFKIINKIKNENFKVKLYNHLNTLSENDLFKVLVIFSQNLTLFAEYNFNTCLSLNEIRINEILILGEDKKLKLNFNNLDDEQYKNVITLLSTSSFDSLEKLHGENIDNSNTVYIKSYFKNYNIPTLSYIYAFEEEIGLIAHIIQKDFTFVPSDLFVDHQYVETRPGVATSILKKSTSELLNQTTNRNVL